MDFSTYHLVSSCLSILIFKHDRGSSYCRKVDGLVEEVVGAQTLVHLEDVLVVQNVFL